MHYKAIIESNREHIATPYVDEPFRVSERIQLQLDYEEALCSATNIKPKIEEVDGTIVIGTVSVRRVV